MMEQVGASAAFPECDLHPVGEFVDPRCIFSVDHAFVGRPFGRNVDAGIVVDIIWLIVAKIMFKPRTASEASDGFFNIVGAVFGSGAEFLS